MASGPENEPAAGTVSTSVSTRTPDEPVRDPELAAVVVAWPALPTALRAGILAMVRASGIERLPAELGR